MEKWLPKNAEKTAKDTFELGGIGSDLPEIKINLNEIKNGNQFFRFYC